MVWCSCSLTSRGSLASKVLSSLSSWARSSARSVGRGGEVPKSGLAWGGRAGNPGMGLLAALGGEGTGCSWGGWPWLSACTVALTILSYASAEGGDTSTKEGAVEASRLLVPWLEAVPVPEEGLAQAAQALTAWAK